MAFSDTIETDFLLTVYLFSESLSQDSNGNYGTTITTIAHTLKGDIQPASRWLHYDLPHGDRSRITHLGLFDVPTTLPAPANKCRDTTNSKTYEIRNVSNWPGDHLELDLEEIV